MSGIGIPDEEQAPSTTTAPPAQIEVVEPETETRLPFHDSDGNFNPPDGGMVAWSQVIAALLVNAMSWGYPNAFGVYQLYYVETMKLPAAQVSWIGSVQTFLTFGVCMISGRLTDAGYARHCSLAGSFLAVFGTFMASLSTEYWQIFLSQGVCTGLGLGILFMPATTTASSYFKENRAFALSFATIGSSIGSLIFPSIVQYLIPQIGFPWAMRCAGFMALAITTVANLILKPYLPPRKAGPILEWGAFKEKPYVFFLLASFLNLYTLYFGFFYINSYARDIVGFTAVEAVSVLLIANGMAIPVRPFIGYLGDKYVGALNVYMCALLSLGVVTYGWIGAHTRAGMYVFAVFYGVATGCSQGIFAGALATLTRDPRKMGTRFGMTWTIGGFATLAGPPTAGAIIGQSGGDYTWAQVWGGTVAVGAALAALACRTSIIGLKWAKR